jgi:hypothetical protein
MEIYLKKHIKASNWTLKAKPYNSEEIQISALKELIYKNQDDNQCISAYF